MRLVTHRSTNRSLVILLLLSVISSGVVGCGLTGGFTKGLGSLTSRSRSKHAGLQVTPLSNQDVVTLSADDIVALMRRAGFSDQQIWELGTDVRNALLVSGAAQVRLKDKVEAIFAVHKEYVFITTRLRGSFIYDVNAGGFGLHTASPRR